MPAAQSLSAYRVELADALERMRQDRHSAQSGLVGEHIALAGSLSAGPLCLALADGLGASKEARRPAGLTTAFLELAALSLRGLEGESGGNPIVVANGLPLALNAADALYSLAHLATLELAAQLEGLESIVPAAFDSLTLEIWQQQSNDGAASGMGRTAGVLAALAAGRPTEAESMGQLGASIIAGAPAGETVQLLEGLPLGAERKERLSAILA